MLLVEQLAFAKQMTYIEFRNLVILLPHWLYLFKNFWPFLPKMLLFCQTLDLFVKVTEKLYIGPLHFSLFNLLKEELLYHHNFSLTLSEFMIISTI